MTPGDFSLHDKFLNEEGRILLDRAFSTQGITFHIANDFSFHGPTLILEPTEPRPGVYRSFCNLGKVS